MCGQFVDKSCGIEVKCWLDEDSGKQKINSDKIYHVMVRVYIYIEGKY
jgi:hypothetical protein